MNNSLFRLGTAILAIGLISGCRDLSIDIAKDSPKTPEKDIATSPPPFFLNLDLAQAKKFVFSWPEIDGADHYKLYENVDGISGFTQVGADIPAGTDSYTLEVPLFDRVNAQYMIEHCSDTGCESSDVVSPRPDMIGAIGYFKPGKFGSGEFGAGLDLSYDGKTMVVGEPFDDSASQGVNSDESDVSGFRNGSAHVFINEDGNWSKDAYIKPAISDIRDAFGEVVAIDDAGDTMLVTAYSEDSLNNDPSDNSGFDAGSAYIFEKVGGVWTQAAYLKASNPDSFDEFGQSGALSGDGLTAVIGSFAEYSNAQGINGNEANNDAGYSGAAYVFRNNAGTWSQEAYIKSSNSETDDEFGYDVDLSSDGNVLVVGATGEDSDADGVNGSEVDNTASRSGAAYVFSRSGTTWTQDAYLKASNSEANTDFGYSVAIADDGLTLVVGSPREKSRSTGVNGDDTDTSGFINGAAYVFVNNAGTWSQQAYLKPGFGIDSQRWGWKVAISSTGDRVLMSGTDTDSNKGGLGTNEANQQNENTGSVLLFKRDTGVWSSQEYIKAINPGKNENFGWNVSISGDESTIAASSIWEQSGTTGVNGPAEQDPSQSAQGAVYLY